MCVNNFPTVALDSASAGIEPAISSRKSNALTTTPPKPPPEDEGAPRGSPGRSRCGPAYGWRSFADDGVGAVLLILFAGALTSRGHYCNLSPSCDG